MSKIAIVDYGMGNIRSVAQAVMHVAPECEVIIASQPEQIQKADRVILPGQGAMPDCMEQLYASGLFDEVQNALKLKPLLGVCVGEQMLFETSDETHTPNTPTNCLGVFKGHVTKFEVDTPELTQKYGHLKVPHMGWNEVFQQQSHPLWENVPSGTRFYFVHSYYVVPEQNQDIFGTTEYGHVFTSAVAKENIFATQFHPEKSAKYGLQIYHNFTRWNP